MVSAEYRFIALQRGKWLLTNQLVSEVAQSASNFALLPPPPPRCCNYYLRHLHPQLQVNAQASHCALFQVFSLSPRQMSVTYCPMSTQSDQATLDHNN